MRLNTLGWLLAIAAAVMFWFVLPSSRLDFSQGAGPLRLATTQAPVEVPLGDLVSGRVRPGFFPVLDDSVAMEPVAGRAFWVRVGMTLPDTAEGRWYLRLERVPLQRVRLFAGDQLETPVAEARYLRLGSWDARWPDGYILPLPEGLKGPINAYLQVEGDVDLRVRPQLLAGAALEAREAASQRLFVLIYALFLLAALMALVPAVRAKGGGGWRLLGLALLGGVTIALINDHLPPAMREVLSGVLGGSRLYSLSVLFAGALLLAARRYAGLDAFSSGMSKLFHRLGWVMCLLAAAGTLVPDRFGDVVQRIAELLWAQAWVLVLVALSQDRRRLGHVMVGLVVVLLAALVARACAAAGLLEPSALALFGYQVMVALLLLALVLMPWARRLPAAVEAAAQLPPPPTIDELWEAGRKRLRLMIDDAARHAPVGSDVDALWGKHVAQALIPLMEADGVAVAHAGLHRCERVFCEPASEAEVLRAEVEERARALRPLVRLGSPQLLLMPARGDGGHGQLAVLPITADDTSWSAVLVRRYAGSIDPDLLDRAEAVVQEMRALFVASRAHAAQAVRDEIDPVTQLQNAEGLQKSLRQAFDRCRDLLDPFAVIKVWLGDVPGQHDWQAHTLINALADIDAPPQLLVGRTASDEITLVLPKLDVPRARAFAERLRKQVVIEKPPESGITEQGRRPTVADWPMGISGLVPGERVPMPLLERANEALLLARVPGANGIQAVVPIKH